MSLIRDMFTARTTANYFATGLAILAAVTAWALFTEQGRATLFIVEWLSP